MSVPSFERLQGDIGLTYQLSGPWGGPVAADLRYVSQGVPMNSRYCCYSAGFALPQGIGMAQATCTVSAGSDQWHCLLLTPLGPDEDGRQLMQMVFHYPIPQGSVTVGSAGEQHA